MRWTPSIGKVLTACALCASEVLAACQGGEHVLPLPPVDGSAEGAASDAMTSEGGREGAEAGARADASADAAADASVEADASSEASSSAVVEGGDSDSS